MADVDERAELAVAPADHCHGTSPTGLVANDRARKPARVCDVLPCSPEDSLLLEPSDGRVDVPVVGSC